MTSYSPFNKNLEDIEGPDLASLKEASEGWYIEYKSETSNASTIAKSVSAFANTYGGWVFYGVSEKSKEEPVAGSFPGVETSLVDAMLQRIRQAVAAQINPSPHFDTKVIYGPCAEIGLKDGSAVICVRVSWSPTAPHVHKSGLIYRRVADGSEPKPENDRFVLDQLWGRSKETRKSYRKWVCKDPNFTEGEASKPYVRLLLDPDLWGREGANINAPLDDIRKILGDQVEPVNSFPFDTIYTTNNGWIARQNKNNNPFDLGLTWKFGVNLTSEILIPLSLYVKSRPLLLMDDLEGYNQGVRFTQMLEEKGYRSTRVVDLNFLFSILISIVENHKQLMNLAGWKGDYYAKVRLLNTWRTVPFVDIGSVMGHYNKYGVPMCLDEIVTVPPGLEPDSFYKISEYAHVEDQYSRSILQALELFRPIATAFGVPDWFPIDKEGKLPAYFEELQQAGHRANEVQLNRNARRRSEN